MSKISRADTINTKRQRELKEAKDQAHRAEEIDTQEPRYHKNHDEAQFLCIRKKDTPFDTSDTSDTFNMIAGQMDNVEY